MTPVAVDQLLKENQAQLLRERRLANRTPFVRPIVIQAPRGKEMTYGFTRDISALGIGVISPEPWEPPSIVSLEIHRLNGSAVKLKAETRWCEEYGDGWFVLGFTFR